MHIAQLSEVKYSMLRIKLGYLSLTRALNKSRQTSRGCLSGMVFGPIVKGNHKPSSTAVARGVDAGIKKDQRNPKQRQKPAHKAKNLKF